MPETEVRITGTILSGKPREESLPVSILACLLPAFTSMLAWRSPLFFRLLAASPERALEGGEYWRLFSTIAVHADLAHLAMNLCFMAFFGYLLYGYFGFWVYPVAMVTLGALTTLLSLLTYPPKVILIGASGLVYVMASFWLGMYALVERTVPLRKRLLRTVGLALIVLVPTAVRPEVSYRTHFMGSGVGLIAALAYFESNKRKIRAHESLELEIVDEPHRPST